MVKTKTKTRVGSRVRIPTGEMAVVTGEKNGAIQCTTSLKLDIGCGPNKKPGFVGCDSIAFPGVDVVTDLTKPWPWPDNSVEEAHASHVLEHFEAKERWHFMNELYRVLKPGAKATIITPDWCSQRAYGDMTHKWPPVSGFFWFYLSKEWRAANAPHNDAAHVEGGLNCNFGAQWGPSVHPEIATRNQEYQQHAITFFKEACQDMICTITKA